MYVKRKLIEGRINARLRPFARMTLRPAKPLRLERKFACRIKLICPVQTSREKYSA
jgi:hypothetical protein